MLLLCATMLKMKVIMQQCQSAVTLLHSLLFKHRVVSIFLLQVGRHFISGDLSSPSPSPSLLLLLLLLSRCPRRLQHSIGWPHTAVMATVRLLWVGNWELAMFVCWVASAACVVRRSTEAVVTPVVDMKCNASAVIQLTLQDA